MQRRALELQYGAPEPADAPDPLAEDLDALTVYTGPALIMVGEHDMEDFALAADALAAALPGARQETIAGAGHLAPLEQPLRTRELLLELLLESAASGRPKVRGHVDSGWPFDVSVEPRWEPSSATGPPERNQRDERGTRCAS